MLCWVSRLIIELSKAVQIATHTQVSRTVSVCESGAGLVVLTITGHYGRQSSILQEPTKRHLSKCLPPWSYNTIQISSKPVQAKSSMIAEGVGGMAKPLNKMTSYIGNANVLQTVANLCS